ncbi:MAG TPA: hypothetical protein VK358_10435 [Longimicrobium sp.]|nr:hypothetical protein [Longimicrobium sp.]
MSNAAPAAAVAVPGWEEDIAGIFAPFTNQMMWRLNLNSYEDVKANASIISSNINWQNGSAPSMPPPPFPPLPGNQIAMFDAWVKAGCPQTRPATS